MEYQVVSVSQSMVTITEQEYLKYINLKKEVEQKNNEIHILIQQIKTKDDKIEILEKERDELLKRVSELEKLVLEQKIIINKLENKEYTKSLMIALQDLNHNDKLIETYPEYIEVLNELHNDRINLAHYIRDNDNEHLKRYKKYLLFNHLKNIPLVIKEQIELDYGEGFIDFIMNHIKNTNMDYKPLSDKLKNKADRWWL